MLETFKSRLKTKYAGVNLSQKRIDAIADRLHKKFPDITEEADHDAKIDDYYDEVTVKEIAKEDDRIRTLEANQKKPEQKNDNQQQQQNQNDNQQQQQNDDARDKVPEWAKGLIATVQTLAAEKTAQTRAATLKAKFEEKKVPEKFWQKMKQPEKEEEFDVFVTEVAKDYEELVPASDFVPGRSNQRTTSPKATEKEVNNLVDSLMHIQPEINKN